MIELLCYNYNTSYNTSDQNQSPTCRTSYVSPCDIRPRPNSCSWIIKRIQALNIWTAYQMANVPYQRML